MKEKIMNFDVLRSDMFELFQYRIRELLGRKLLG